jgi:hypothetical protein
VSPAAILKFVLPNRKSFMHLRPTFPFFGAMRL